MPGDADLHTGIEQVTVAGEGESEQERGHGGADHVVIEGQRDQQVQLREYDEEQDHADNCHSDFGEKESLGQHTNTSFNKYGKH